MAIVVKRFAARLFDDNATIVQFGDRPTEPKRVPLPKDLEPVSIEVLEQPEPGNE